MTGPREERRIRLDSIVGALCGWSGCGALASMENLPSGWRALVVSKYDLLDPAGVLNAEVDRVLCPEHVQALKRLLK